VQLPDGRLAVLEHKTTGDSLDPTGDYWRRLRIDHQITLYLMAARALGYEVETVLYDVTRKPGIAPKQVPVLDEQGRKIVLDADGNRVFKRDGQPYQSGNATKGWRVQTRTETPDEFAARYRRDMGERPDWYFARREIARTSAEIAEFEYELWQTQQLIRGCQRHGRWFRNTHACLHPYRCPYRDICFGDVDLERGDPDGFVRVSYVHPELLEGANDERNDDETATGAAAPCFEPGQRELAAADGEAQG